MTKPRTELDILEDILFELRCISRQIGTHGDSAPDWTLHSLLQRVVNDMEVVRRG